MGCCVGTMKNINLKHEVFVKPEKIENKQEIDIRNPNSKNLPKDQKEEFDKENSLNVQKTEKNDTKNDKATQNNISYQTYFENEEKSIKVNKKKVVKQGSKRVQKAMKELKLLSMKELYNNKNFFT